jgi:hypothetical protein
MLQLLNQVNTSIYIFKELYIRRVFSSKIDKNNGMFYITVKGNKTNPIAYFTYLDLNSNTITHSKVHNGNHYYKEFIGFIDSTASKLDKNKVRRVLAPKLFINKSIIDRTLEIYGIQLEGYNTKSANYPSIAKVIKDSLRGHVDLDDYRLQAIVKEFNKRYSTLRKRSQYVDSNKLSNKRFFTSTTTKPKWVKINKHWQN